MEEKDFLENENERQIWNQKISADNKDEKWDHKIKEIASSYQHFSSNLFQENKSKGEIEEMKIPEKWMIYKMDKLFQNPFESNWTKNNYGHLSENLKKRIDKFLANYNSCNIPKEKEV